jgi:ABC-2 type transport system permease protein/lipopolysaccharide transport system permease protein
MSYKDRLTKDAYIIKSLALSELKIRYKRNALGFFWSLLNPILNISLVGLVFSKIMNMGYKEFIIFLLPGIVAWNLFVNTVNSCSGSMIYNERLIRSVAINKVIFPIVSAATVIVDFCLSLFALVALGCICLLIKLQPSLLILPLSILLLASFAMGLGMIVSVATVYWRDVTHIVSVLLQILFFMSPILYPKARLGSYSELAKLNPMLHYIDLFREPIYNGHFPSLITIGITILLSIASLVIGYIILKKTSDNLIFRL